jgi:hypothetical protein
MTSSWIPTPKALRSLYLKADLLGCHTLIVGGNANFTTQLALLLARLLNQTGTAFATNLEGLMSQTSLKTNNFVSFDQLYKAAQTAITWSSDTNILGTLTLTPSSSITVNNSLVSGATLFQILATALGTSNYVYMTLGNGTSTNNGLEIRFVNASPNPYGAVLLTGSSSGFRVLSTQTNFLTELRIKNVRVNPIVLSTYTTLSNATNPTPGISWTTASGLNRVDVSFVDLTQATYRSTIFIQCGQGTSWLTTAGQYSGFTVGNYSFNLTPPGIIMSTTNQGIAIFCDYLEVGGILNGQVNFYKVGTPTNLGDLWAFQVQVYAQMSTSSTPQSYATGFGYVQFPLATPSFTSVRLNSFAGNWGSGAWSTQYV